MTLASDQNLDRNMLSETSRKMLDLKEAVLQEWEIRVRSAFKEARELREPIFINTIPPFYDNIVQAVTPSYPRANATEGTTLAYAHGSERARLTDYDPAILMLEYQMFKAALLHVLQKNSVQLSSEELLVINSSIDEAIREAVMAFSASISAMREQFIAALTHDMRTPLNTASMAAEIISLTTDVPRIKDLARQVVESITRADKMAQSMLDTMVFNQGQQLRLELTNFDMLVLAQEICNANRAKESSRCKVMGNPIYGWWSHDAMQRALENLVSNAIKYGEPRTPITVALESTHGSVVISVHNEGLPIPIEEQQAVFQVFKRSENAAKNKQGWGVGLPYVRAVAESHGGAVTIDSAVQRGTTFTITMPVDARPFQDTPAVCTD